MRFSHKQKKQKNLLFIILLIFFICGSTTICEAKKRGNISHQGDAFPLYSAIVNNVTFWENIYNRYPNEALLVHDSDDLRKIYATVRLLPATAPNARNQNANTEKRVEKKIQNILKQLVTTPPRTNLEKRVAALFPKNNKTRELQQAIQQIRTQNGQRQRFRKSVIRSGAYIKKFKEIFRSYNLPEDLAYLPHVESSFHPGAYSKAGASGIWQFTRSTGKRYLIIDSAVDQRLDPIAATHAAAKYFRRSYSHLKHWPLAITSYNYGLPGTIRAKEEFGSYTKVFRSHRTKTFKFAARNFYSEFLAARKTAKAMEGKIPLNKPEKTYSMPLKGYLRIQDVTNYFRISEKELKRLNPALLPPVFQKNRRITKGYTLHLPATTTIKKKIAAFPGKLYYAKQQSARYHQVRKGESISSIASHFGITTKALRKANNLGKNHIIKINQRLHIPAKASISAPKKINLRTDRQKRMQPKKPPLLKATRKKITRKDV